MSQNVNKFSFELNESLYFDKGQEVAEMVQISLEPDITIQPFHDYISIRGVIELQGEYRKVPAGEIEVEDTAANHADMRFMDHVSDSKEMEAIFTHGFPIEISVPAYRVEDLNNIAVSIGSFDYDIPEQNRLQLNSTVDIHGIQMEQKHQDDNDTHAEEARAAEISEAGPAKESSAESETTEERDTVQSVPTTEHSMETEHPLQPEAREAEQPVEQEENRETEQTTDIPEIARQSADYAETKQPEPDTPEQDETDKSVSASSIHDEDTVSFMQEAVEAEKPDETRFQFDIKPEQQVSETTAASQSEEPAEIQRSADSQKQEDRDADHNLTAQADVPAAQPKTVEETVIREESREESELNTAEGREQTETETPQAETEVTVAEQEVEQEEKERWKNKKSQSLAEFFKTEPSPDPAEAVTDADDPPPADPFPSSSDLDFELSSSSYESFESSSGPADVRYLSDMFRNEEEDQFTRLRLCIVQQQDTVESIAERYQVPTLQILKQNQLDGDNLAEGQLLYIPAKKNH